MHKLKFLPNPATRSSSPTRLNLLLAVFFFIAQIYILFLFPFVAKYAREGALALLIAAVFLMQPTWYLIHEAVHDILHPDLGTSRWVGRILAIMAGIPFSGIRLAHLLHHRWNRVEELAEVYDPRETSRLAASVKHFFLILGGLYWVEFLGSLALYLPLRLRQKLGETLAGTDPYMKRFYQAVNRPQNAHAGRVEALAIALLYVAAFALYGNELRIYLICALLGRSFFTSFFDNSFHYETPINTSANPTLTRNHAMPFSWIILNFNYHFVHHQNPSLPWSELPRKARAEEAAFDGGFLARGLRQLRGPLTREKVSSLEY